MIMLVFPSFADESRRPTGSWLGIAKSTTVPLPPLQVLLTFSDDGTLIESRRLFLPASPLGPLIATPGHGEWRKTGPREFAATIVLLYEGAADHPTSAGAVVGKEKVRYKFQIADNGKIQGNILVEVVDINGNAVFLGEGTIEASRIRVETLP
jgi:hypothetical protein